MLKMQDAFFSPTCTTRYNSFLELLSNEKGRSDGNRFRGPFLFVSNENQQAVQLNVLYPFPDLKSKHNHIDNYHKAI